MYNGSNGFKWFSQIYSHSSSQQIREFSHGITSMECMDISGAQYNYAAVYIVLFEMVAVHVTPPSECQEEYIAEGSNRTDHFLDLILDTW